MSSIQQILKDARTAMDRDIAHVKHEFSTVRSGKASPSMLETVKVDMYGQSMQLNQVATIKSGPWLAFAALGLLCIGAALAWRAERDGSAYRDEDEPAAPAPEGAAKPA